MIRVFYGDDRVRARDEIERVFGGEFEVIDGEDLGVGDLPSLFFGVSLFDGRRRVLVKDLAGNTEAFFELPKYLDGPHEVVLWETKLDKRTATYKALLKQKVEMREFRLAEAPEKKMVFDVLDIAWRGDGRRAVEMLSRIEVNSDAYMFMGLLVSQVLRKLENGDRKAEAVLKLLAEYDMKMKSTAFEPWTLVKAAIVEIASL